MLKPVLPGAAIGVLGSGQLGRMLTIAARRMGYRVHTYSPESDTPTGQVSDVEVSASYDDLDAVRQFAGDVGVVTFEFENVPAATTSAAAEGAPVRPSGYVLHTTQHRLREKTFLQNAGLPVTPFKAVRQRDELPAALKALGYPAVLKSADFGYDGKGQFRIEKPEQLDEAWSVTGPNERILEKFIAFQCEVSVVAARGQDGQFVHYGVFENAHRNSILDITLSPARVAPKVAQQAVAIAGAVLERLDVVGVLCVEFFVDQNDRLMINELAPRPHNSGHFTFDANITSQFEQQLRAVCLLPLGNPAQLRPAAMANLLGDLWSGGEPDWAAACAFPDVKLHLYGKQEARPGRKMGHLTAFGDTVEQAHKLVRAAREALTAKHAR